MDQGTYFFFAALSGLQYAAQLLDVTALLRAEAMSTDESQVVKTLRAQTTCIAWSSQANFNMSPVPLLDGSLLAIANRAGSTYPLYKREIMMNRLVRNLDGSWDTCTVATISLSDKWVNYIAWSNWVSSERGECEAHLACGVTDGSIAVIRVAQALQSRPSASGLIPHYEIECNFSVQDDKACESDGRSITSLQWINVIDCCILSYTKPGCVYLRRHPLGSGSWSDTRKIPLHTQKVSVGASALCSVSGTAYISRTDTLVLSLADGSFHVIHAVSTEPSTEPLHSGHHLTSETISRAIRAVFVKAEPEPSSTKDIQRIYGTTSYDGYATFVWLHEKSRPTEFNYKHEARHVSMLVVARLSDGYYTDEDVLLELHDRVNGACAGAAECPDSLLRPILSQLREPAVFSRVYKGVLNILQNPLVWDNIPQVIIPAAVGDLTSDTRRDFRRSLSMHFFGWDVLLSLRMRYVVAEYCKNTTDDPGIRQAFDVISTSIFVAIMHHTLRTIIRHIAAVMNLLSPADMPFVLRVAVQASLPGSAVDLTREADELLMKLKDAVLRNDQPPPGVIGLSEPCPACDTQIPFEDVSTAICLNGHVWSRCSITFIILATPAVRTCVGCRRKALLPASSAQAWLPGAVRASWLAAEMLEGTRRCFFCGSHFVTLV
ncbi:uncharacterized protein FIBRA_04674 [Fibroporia radiculosa]|uniref:Transcription factor IIIC putative zinc-finger domain-containing protein n=1 Tax=Fibroporia radiculosa TaxID=599839 RepID=J4IAA5_9APHY|nr:uncharacterized protein FIBRA_04674 [Fibroporia radiculosa]CCM02571.1 predicted protein [Fibroporia radiculosa]